MKKSPGSSRPAHHAEAAKILGNLDNVPAEVVEGNMRRDSSAAVSGSL